MLPQKKKEGRHSPYKSVFQKELYTIKYSITMKCLTKIILCIALILSVNSAAVTKEEEETELLLVSVIFRHGARTTYAFYPTDPNRNETFYPIGLGGLTNEGKFGEYQLGDYLRSLYGNFLGEVYTEEKVYIRSTDVTRTKMSAQLVLAGLFPPTEIQQWNADLMWQPIPVSYKPEADEDLFHPTANCPYKVNILENLPNLPEVQDTFIKPYKEVFDYIQKNSGKTMNHPADMQDFFFIIKTESDMNLTIPNWTTAVFPEPTQSIAGQVYGYHNYEPKVRKINVGFMLKKILDDSLSRIDGTISPPERKLFLYSGHESTVGYMLNALNVTSPHVPPYGSALSFEIRRGGNKVYIKLRYRDATDAIHPIDLKIPNCDVLCPLDTFIKLQRHLLPTETIQDMCKL